MDPPLPILMAGKPHETVLTRAPSLSRPSKGWRQGLNKKMHKSQRNFLQHPESPRDVCPNRGNKRRRGQRIIRGGGVGGGMRGVNERKWAIMTGRTEVEIDIIEPAKRRKAGATGRG